MRRRQSSMRAGDRITAPNGTVVVLPKDWVDLTRDDLVALGLGPDQPPGATVTGFIPLADLPLRERLWVRLKLRDFSRTGRRK